MEIRADKFDFWRAPLRGRQARIMADPRHVEELEAVLKMLNINFSVDSNDVQKWANIQFPYDLHLLYMCQ